MQIFVFIVFFALALVVDVGTKGYFEELLQYRDLWIIDDVIGLHLAYNSGVAFSLPITGLPLQGLTLLLIGGMFWYYLREEYPQDSRLLATGYGLILGGACSHAYERIFIGHVVDFIWVKYFAILNFADIFISLGAFIIILYYVRQRYNSHT